MVGLILLLLHQAAPVPSEFECFADADRWRDVRLNSPCRVLDGAQSIDDGISRAI